MPKSSTKVVPLFGRSTVGLDGPEPTILVAPVRAPASPTVPVEPVGLDLTGKSKALLLIGPGGSGKTMLARWIADRMNERGGEAVIAALDPGNRSLGSWFTDVAMPDISDSANTTDWLLELLGYLMDQKQSGLLDFGGGDTSLARAVTDTPDLVEALRQGALEVVAVYVLTPRIDDLATLISLESIGFRPRATLFVLNEGRADDRLSREVTFAHVLRHSAFRSAQARGAISVWMPRLGPIVAQDIEVKRLHFTQARSSTGWSQRLAVTAWLRRMEDEFAPVASWLLP
jgi:hypothetical protein